MTAMANWKKILVAVDENPTTEKALNYVGELLGAAIDIEITLLHVYPDPPPNFFQEGHSLTEYTNEKEAAARKVFAKSSQLLLKYGLGRDNIASICRMTSGETISQTVIRIQKEGKYGTVVLGKRGVSKAEEFLFGSISNTVVRSSKDFTVWVVG